MAVVWHVCPGKVTERRVSWSKRIIRRQKVRVKASDSASEKKMWSLQRCTLFSGVRKAVHNKLRSSLSERGWCAAPSLAQCIECLKILHPELTPVRPHGSKGIREEERRRDECQSTKVQMSRSSQNVTTEWWIKGRERDPFCPHFLSVARIPLTLCSDILLPLLFAPFCWKIKCYTSCPMTGLIALKLDSEVNYLLHHLSSFCGFISQSVLRFFLALLSLKTPWSKTTAGIRSLFEIHCDPLNLWSR